MNGKLKFVFSLIVGIYFLNSIGIPVYYHYCGGELENVSALFKTNSCCGEEEDEDSDCCQNVVKVVLQQNESSLNEPKVLGISDHQILFSGNWSYNKRHIPVVSSTNISYEIDSGPPEKGRKILLSKSLLII